MSRSERGLFFALRRVLPKENLIWPQIPLRLLVPATKLAGSSAVMRDGSLDFVVTDGWGQRVILGMELDESSHDQVNAVTRDREKTKLLKEIGLPLLRYRVGEEWDCEQMRLDIQKILLKENGPKVLTEKEWVMLCLLRMAVEEVYKLFPKVRLDLMVRKSKWLPDDVYKVWRNDVVDFVLVHRSYLGAVAAIRCDELSACPKERVELLKQVDLPLVPVTFKEANDFQGLRKKIDKAVRQRHS